MKKLLIVFVTVVMLMPSNGCRILKHKTKESRIEKSDIKNDVAVKLSYKDSLQSVLNYITSKSDLDINEEVNIKEPVLMPIELTGNFRLDDKAARGDTLMKLVDPKLGISLAIFAGDKGQATVRLTSKYGSSDIPMREIQYKRNVSSKKETIDTTKRKSEVKSEVKDSVDKSQKKIEKKEVKQDKNKDTKPTLGTFGIVIGSIAVICFFIWLGFKGK
ncbi:hypothetical protein [Pedobacter punctiformis]|uniref:Lipoprotein n=1 Tax=Pedobacter punctiformis TaxID=3004097 RepID=A0ABT4LAN8_9SPHI|nr:hypothetical protein [Pedobacter sp. HCMS5-2]MCZ4244989.1 hypothetical protein [Pedobacter sp. HCMS5-2]